MSTTDTFRNHDGEGPRESRLALGRDAVRVAATAAWMTSQVVAEAKSRALHLGTPPDEGIWKEINAPRGHGGSPPRRIDKLAHDTMARAIRQYRPEAVIRSEEEEGVWDEEPGTQIFIVDPEDGTDPGRAVFFGDASVALVFEIDDRGRRRFGGGAIATADFLLHYHVFNRTVVEALLLTPPRGATAEAVMPTSSVALSTAFEAVVPGDPAIMAVVGARQRHRAREPIARLFSPANTNWVIGLGGTPLAVQLVRGALGSLISPGEQSLRDAAHLPLIAGLEGGVVTNHDGSPLSAMELFETSETVPASIAASSPEALAAAVAELSP